MLLAEPPQTPYDLSFQVMGFPVRIHPLFWVAGLFLGFNSGGGIGLIIWIFAFFISILIHELGHALMIRHYGRDAYIVLYAMGGLAIEGRPHSMFGNPWSFEASAAYSPPRSRTAQEQIIISAAGPGIQFLLAGAIIAVIYAMRGHVVWVADPIPIPIPVLSGELANNVNLKFLLAVMLQINIFWPLLNLVPVLPLDGGQIALQVLVQKDPWAGMQRALWLSVIAGGAMAIFSLFVMHQTFTMLLFASLAVSSYLALQQTGGRRPW